MAEASDSQPVVAGAAELAAAVEEMLRDIEQINARTEASYQEIERLKTETRRMLREMQSLT